MEQLYEEERKARTGGKTEELRAIQHSIVASCRSDEEIIAALRMLTNKRKQDPHCIKDLIKSLYESKKSIGFYYSLLSDVIESKIYLEEERLYIAEHIKLLHGNDVAQAFAIIRDIPVETFTSINEKRRNAFLFEQFRLALLLNTLGEAELIARRVRRSYLADEEKIIFFNYSILLRVGQKAYLEAARLYLELNQVDPSRKNVAVGSFYCMLSSCLVEKNNVIGARSELLREFAENKLNDPVVRIYVERFNSNMILGADLIESVIKNVKRIHSIGGDPEDGAVDMYRNELKNSIIEHNLLIVGKFVSKITISQLCTILSLSEDEIIDFISQMVNDKFSDVKINQKDWLVDFGYKTWNSRLDDLLDKLVAVNNLIHQASINDR